MSTLLTSYGVGGESNDMKMEEEEEEEEEEEGDGETSREVCVGSESTVQRCPSFYFTADKEMYRYAGHEITITGSLDSYAGMIWPAALALCRYLETHHKQLSLWDKAVLEIGAGTGLVSIVAALLGAWVTATDLEDTLSHLGWNLSRNTRGRCRYTPQVAALPWGHDLQSTYPKSVYSYDYVLATDVVYHHDHLDQLLATMTHFTEPGTTLIWANQMRFKNDLTFTARFQKAFHTELLVEDGEMKIFTATCRREGQTEDDLVEETRSGLHEEHREEEEEEEEMGEKEKEREEEEREEEMGEKEKEREEEEEEEGEREEEMGEKEKDEDTGRAEDSEQMSAAVQQYSKPVWAPTVEKCRWGNDIYYYVGEKITIHEAFDSYGAVMWPAALALCYNLDNNIWQEVNLEGKEVLELGAGTGLVSIVASLLGARVTATDLPDVMTNLRDNVTRNTRERCRYTPEVSVLSWGFSLQRTHPKSVYRYDYVLAADVVYHHDYLDELLATMKHFCQSGTTLIWANKVRFKADLNFTERFQKAFHTALLFEDGEMKIFIATYRTVAG